MLHSTINNIRSWKYFLHTRFCFTYVVDDVHDVKHDEDFEWIACASVVGGWLFERNEVPRLSSSEL